jgi:archaellum component FlaC
MLLGLKTSMDNKNIVFISESMVKMSQHLNEAKINLAIHKDAIHNIEKLLNGIATAQKLHPGSLEDNYILVTLLNSLLLNTEHLLHVMHDYEEKYFIALLKSIQMAKQRINLISASEYYFVYSNLNRKIVTIERLTLEILKGYQDIIKNIETCSGQILKMKIPTVANSCGRS